IPVVDKASIEAARSYQGVADFLLLDSYDPRSRQFGALGRVHDWTMSRRIVDEIGIPIILAGCLGPENVAEAIVAGGPAGVGSKTRSGRADGAGKDLAQVGDFVAAARLTR